MNNTHASPLQYMRFLLVASLAVILSGCDSIPFIDTTPDYKSTGRGKPLEVPPDLTSVSSNDTYSVPGGSTTYSAFSQIQEGQEAVKEKILPEAANVKLERAGSQRWLVVQADPEKVWPVVREFWAELGFAVRIENPQTGVMETEWVDPSSITKDEKGNYLDKFQGWLDKLNTLKNRQKFRTRLDRGLETGTTEIYLSHRSASDLPADDGKVRVRTIVGEIDNGYAFKPSTPTMSEQARADAEDIDAELLRRMMVRLGVEEKRSKTIMNASKSEIRATLSAAKDGSISLVVNDPFDRAWRRVGLALDRVGFVVEDKDRTQGVYFVRYSDIEADDGQKKKKGFIDSLKFWEDDDKDKEPEKTAGKEGSKDETHAAAKDPKKVVTPTSGDDEKDQASPISAKKSDKSLMDRLKFWEIAEKDNSSNARQYLVRVEEKTAGKSEVSIINFDGVNVQNGTSKRILNMLHEQLK